MRQVMLAGIFAVVITGVAAGRAAATPFEPAIIPDQALAAGHLDVDALRKTQIFAAAGGQTALDAALDQAPPAVRPLAHSLARAARGVSFWRGAERGAVYLETRDAKALAQLLPKLPARPAQAIDGYPTYVIDHGDHTAHIAAFGDTLVLADSDDSLERSIRVLGGKAASLAGSTKLPRSARQGMFVFVTIGDDLLGAIKQSAHAKLLQLGLRTLVIDVSETGGVVTATARGEMRSADQVQKARSILDGLRALGSLSDDPMASALLDGLTVTASGLALEVVAKLPAGELARLIQAKH
jgi:hypothetical protein